MCPNDVNVGNILSAEDKLSINHMGKYTQATMNSMLCIYN